MGYSIFTHRNLNLHTGVIDLTQDLDHTTDCLSIAIGVINNLNAHHLAQLSHPLPLWGDQNVMANALIFGGHDQNTVLVQKTPNDHSIGVDQYLHNLALGATASIGP